MTCTTRSVIAVMSIGVRCTADRLAVQAKGYWERGYAVNRREPEITPRVAKLNPKDAAKVLGVSEEKARELLAKARKPTAPATKGKPTPARRPKANRQSRVADPKRITFYGPLG